MVLSPCQGPCGVPPPFCVSTGKARTGLIFGRHLSAARLAGMTTTGLAAHQAGPQVARERHHLPVQWHGHRQIGQIDVPNFPQRASASCHKQVRDLSIIQPLAVSPPPASSPLPPGRGAAPCPPSSWATRCGTQYGWESYTSPACPGTTRGSPLVWPSHPA